MNNQSDSTNYTTTNEWIPTSKKNPCSFCGNASKWCSVSQDTQFVVCKNTQHAPAGWRKIKDTSDGGGVFRTLESISHNSTRPPKDKPPEKPQYLSVDHATRDRVYRELIKNNGELEATYRAALRHRGISDELINKGIDRTWFANWQWNAHLEWFSDTHNIAGIYPFRDKGRACCTTGIFLPAIKSGLVVGGQVQPKQHIDRQLGSEELVPDSLGKYLWISSTKYNGVNAHAFDTQENPLFLREYPQTTPNTVEKLNLCEGALKSAIAALRFEDENKFVPWLGAAGGIFSELELTQRLDNYPNLKTITIWPDGGDVMNQSVLARWRRTAGLIRKIRPAVDVLVAWWGQAAKTDNDCDELTIADTDRLTIKHWKDSLLAEELATTEQSEATGEEVPEKNWPHFTSDPKEGLLRHEPDGEGGWKTPIRIGNHLQAIARVNNTSGDGAALQLEFKSTNGKTCSWTMARADLAGEGSVIISGLMQRDYGFKRRQKNLLLDYLHELGGDVEKIYTITDSSGWVGASFVMPDRTYGDADLKFRDVEPSPDALTEMTGTLEGWKAGIGAKCDGNSRLIALALGAGFAAPLLPLVGMESGGFHIVGGTSIGKTTILRVASSVVGIKDIPHWRTTANGLESIATASNHMLLPLDEIGQADPKDVGNIAYMLANGQGKARMTKNLTSRKGKTWLLMVLSTGEVELGEYMAQAGITQKGGQEVRLPNIPAMPQGKPYGCFEHIHGAATAQQFVAGLEEAARDHHGAVMDAYLSRLVVDAADLLFAGHLATRVRTIETWLLESQATADSAIGRVAKRFALLYAALELAHHYGLLPFDTAQIPWAVSTVFRDWFVARGGAGSIEVKQAAERIEQILRANEYGDRIYTIPSNDGRQVRNLLGYRLIDTDKYSKGFGQTKEFWIPPIIFDKELAAYVNKGELITELQRRNLLTTPKSDGKAQSQRRVNGRREYFYVIPWDVFCLESEESRSQEA
jgi:uncharacterized protein (DUF927 family)